MSFDVAKNKLVDELKLRGIGEYEIYYKRSDGVSVSTLNREVDSFSSSTDTGVCLRVLIDGKMGYASSELFEEDEMTGLVERAIENASAVEKLDTVGIFGGSESYEELNVAQYVPLGAGELRALAIEIGDAVFAGDERVKEGSCSQVFTSGVEIGLVNSHGLDLSCKFGVNAAAAEAVVSDGCENQSDYSFRELRDNKAEKIQELVNEAIDGAVKKLGAKTVESGKYNVVFSGKEMRSLLAVFSSAFSAKRVLDGMSPLKDKEGEIVASEIVTITDDPQRYGNSVGITFDAEGVATHRKCVVKEGVLQTLLYNRECALAMGKETTANASKASYSSPVGISPYSFCIEPTSMSFDELLALAKDGIYVTEIKGLHAGANAVTGEFSLESAGFMIRDGRLAEAVASFTVAGNFFDLLCDIEALDNKLELGVPMGITGFGSPDVLVPDMSVAGK